MKAIQTFWSEPLNIFLTEQDRFNSFALSLYCAKQYFDKVTLYTDSEGAKILDKLPYDEIIVCYDDVKNYCSTLHWAYPKILTYKQQTEPFIHIDWDLFLFNSPNVKSKALVAQSKELFSDKSSYIYVVKELKTPFPTLSIYLKDLLKQPVIGAYNMGVFGGEDLESIQRYCFEAEHLFNSLVEGHWNNNAVCEQVLAYYMFKDMATLMPEVHSTKEYMFTDWNRSFVHLIGGYKRDRNTLDYLSKLCNDKLPETFKNINLVNT